MHKIVINNDHGGFSISNRAAIWLIENGIEEPYRSNLQKDLSSVWKDLCGGNLPRHHKLLVECVEILGKDANGSTADLIVVETDADSYRIIDKYAGIEEVEERWDADWISLK